MSAGGILLGAPRCSLRGESGYDLRTTASRFIDPSAGLSGGSRFRRRDRMDRGERPTRFGSGVLAARVLPSSPGPLQRDLRSGTEHSSGQARRGRAAERKSLGRQELTGPGGSMTKFDEIMTMHQSNAVQPMFRHINIIGSSMGG